MRVIVKLPQEVFLIPLQRFFVFSDESALLEQCREAGFVFLGEESDGIVSVKIPGPDNEVIFFSSKAVSDLIKIKKLPKIKWRIFRFQRPLLTVYCMFTVATYFDTVVINSHFSQSLIFARKGTKPKGLYLQNFLWTYSWQMCSILSPFHTTTVVAKWASMETIQAFNVACCDPKMLPWIQSTENIIFVKFLS